MQHATSLKAEFTSIKPTCCRGLSADSILCFQSPLCRRVGSRPCQLEVRKHEPRNAVFAGETGLEVIERLIPQARESLKPGGWLVMEISGTIAERVRQLLADWNDVQIAKDLQGIERCSFRREPRRPGRLVRAGEGNRPQV